MRICPIVTCVIAFTLCADFALAESQLPPPPYPSAAQGVDDDTSPDAVPPAVAPEQPSDAKSAKANNKRRVCRQEAREKGLRGHAAADHAAICVAEARLECTKQAVAQGLAKRERNAFVRNCMGEPERKRDQQNSEQ